MAKITKDTNFVDGQVPTASQFNTNFDTIYNEFNGNIDNNNIKGTAAISGTKLADGSITASKIGTSAITLGYVEMTTNQTTITSEVSILNASVTATVPAGGRKVRITGYLPGAGSTVANDRSIVRMKEDGSVIQIAYTTFAMGTGFGDSITISRVRTPTAGTYTWALTMARDTGTGNIITGVGSTTPGYLLVELI